MGRTRSRVLLGACLAAIAAVNTAAVAEEAGQLFAAESVLMRYDARATVTTVGTSPGATAGTTAGTRTGTTVVTAAQTAPGGGIPGLDSVFGNMVIM